eukprot:jgi/Mesvir1/11789/Mv00153-RA.1
MAKITEIETESEDGDVSEPMLDSDVFEDSDGGSSEDPGADDGNDFGETMRKAVELKRAQLKERRRVFEAAPEFLQHTLAHAKSMADLRRKPVEERLRAAKALKEKGNQLYGKGDCEAALQIYTQAMSHFRWFDRVDDEGVALRGTGDEEGEEGRMTPNERKVASEFVVSVFLNSAACLLKLGNRAREVVSSCDEALQIDPMNAKGYYRRAQARLQLGTSTDLNEAVKDLFRACKSDPNNAAIRAEYLRRKEEARLQQEKDRAVMGGMFNRGELYNKEQEQAFHIPDRLKCLPEEERRLAKEMGLDLNDPKVAQAIDHIYFDLDKSTKERAGSDAAGLTPSWLPEWARSSGLFDLRRWWSIPRVLLTSLIVFFLYRMLTMVQASLELGMRMTHQATRGPSQPTVVDAMTEDPVWDD